MPHRQSWPREPVPAPRRSTSRATGRRSAPRSWSTARSSAPSPAWRRPSCPPARSATCAARSNRRRRSSCAGTAAPAQPSRHLGRARHHAGTVTTKRVPSASMGSTRASPPIADRQLADDGEADAGADRAARHRPRRVEALEHAREVVGRDARAVVVDADPHAPAAPRDARPSTATSRTSARSRRGWRRSAPSRSGSRSPAPRRRRRHVERHADVAPPAGGTPRPRRRTTARASTGRGVQRELVGVEPGEVEQVGDESLEPTRLRRDHRRGARAALRRRRAVPSAIASA